MVTSSKSIACTETQPENVCVVNYTGAENTSSKTLETRQLI